METIIKPSELRAGNCLKSEELSIPRLGIWSNGVFQITELGIAHLAENPRLGQFWQPIPITEQWLIDAGFVHETISQRGNKIYRKQAPEMKFDLEVINNNFFFGNRQIIYVHDLQNGYHWHSGEELILNR